LSEKKDSMEQKFSFGDCLEMWGKLASEINQKLAKKIFKKKEKFWTIPTEECSAKKEY
jgi:hypothetical protein